jgi:hypothetical protein
VTLAFGIFLIYGLGAGYFGVLAVPTPFNFVVAPFMLLGLNPRAVEICRSAPVTACRVVGP